MPKLSETEVGERLFREKALGDVRSTYFASFEKPLPALAISTWFFLIAAALAIAIFISDQDASKIRSFTEEIVGISLTLTSTFFGVAIAGFTIFASSLDRNTLTKMIETDHKENVSILNYLYSMFTFTLSALFSVFVSAMVYLVFLSAKAPLVALSHSLTLSERHTEFITLAFLTIFLSQLVFVLLLLRAFVWNLHQLLLLIAALNYTNDDA